MWERRWRGEGDRQHCCSVNSLSLTHLAKTHTHTQTHQNRYSMQRECHINAKRRARQRTPDTYTAWQTDTPPHTHTHTSKFNAHTQVICYSTCAIYFSFMCLCLIRAHSYLNHSPNLHSIQLLLCSTAIIIII